MKTLLLSVLTLAILLIATAIVLGQPSIPAAPSQAPIDGGLGLLAAFGGGYALKKIRDRNITEESSDK